MEEEERVPMCEDCPSHDKRPALKHGLCKRCLAAALAEDHKDGEA